MYAIKTKILPTTDTKPTRIVATCGERRLVASIWSLVGDKRPQAAYRSSSIDARHNGPK